MDFDMAVFDLDGTLAESKSEIGGEMVALLSKLLEVKKVAVMSGGAFRQFERQFLSQFNDTSHFANLFILPASGTQLWEYSQSDNTWKEKYEHDFTTEEEKKIKDAFQSILEDRDLVPEKTYGEVLEDRGSQITFSALGQHAPVDLKKAWDPDQKKRITLRDQLASLLPECEVRIGGLTSIDVTKKGMDKAYGLHEIARYADIPIEHMVYVGDALFEGGNDAVVKITGVRTIQVSGPGETLELLKNWLA